MLDIEHVIDGLSAMKMAGLDDFGKWPASGKALAEMAAVWHGRLVANNITPQEFVQRLGQVLDRGGEFPSLGKFMRPILDERPSAAIIQDPVIVSTNELGCDTIGSRHYAEARGIDYRECSDPPQKALQATSEQREDAKKRLDSLPVTELAKSKRIKASDLIAQDKRIQSLPQPTPKEVDEKRQLLREQALRQTG